MRSPNRRLVYSVLMVISCVFASNSFGRQYWGIGVVYVESTIVGRIVDESGNPVPNAIVDSWNFRGERRQSISDQDGLARITLLHGAATVIARDIEGTLCGHATIHDAAEGTDTEITLEPARRLTISTLQHGQPIPDARVEVHWENLPIAEGVTDTHGVCRLAIPDELIIQSLITFKPGVGFAGFTRPYDDIDMQDEDRGDEFTFELYRTTRYEVRVVNQDGEPVAGMTVFPDSVHLPSLEKPFFLHATHTFDTLTDQDGKAAFFALPEEATEVDFQVETNEHYHFPSVQSDVAAIDDVMTYQVVPRQPISGVVLFPNGSPAPGVPICIDGEGPGFDWFHEETISNERGEFEFSAPPDYACLIGVFKHPYPALPLAGFVIPHDGRLDGLVLQLTEPTYFRGTVRNFDGSELAYSFLDIEQTVEPQRFAIEGEDYEFTPRAQRIIEVDENGDFEFIIGPGSYSAFHSHHTPESNFDFEVTDESEIIHHFRLRANAE